MNTTQQHLVTSSNGSAQFDWEIDDDTNIMRGKVSIWTRPIERSKFANTEAASRLIKHLSPSTRNNTSEHTQDDESLYKPLTKHWALVFEWGEKVATYQATDVNEFLIPSWWRNYPEGNTWDTQTEIGYFYLSPNQVNYAAHYNELNGHTYTIGHTNCQEWLKVLARSLNFELPFNTILDTAPFAAILATGAELLKKHPEKFGDFLEDNPDDIASAVVDKAADVVHKIKDKGSRNKGLQDKLDIVTYPVVKSHSRKKAEEKISHAVSSGAKYAKEKPEAIVRVSKGTQLLTKGIKKMSTK
ncbi:unnamed protein product [Meganyctiphanes norvegica]|uniref:Uncharacterized protein n=1 Tax=Meganyctiphanes norvegica TaxID=48144 RepID=A0AAV2Q3X6_MEGNR